MKGASRSDESVLIARLKSGDETAFRQLFSDYSNQIYRVAYQYLNQRDESLEIVQEVFMKIWMHRDRLLPELPLVPYLIRIAKNILFNRVKRKLIERAYIHNLEYQLRDKSENMEHGVHVSELKKIVNEQVDQFPPKRKEIFILSRTECLSNSEIARKMNISERTVENQINKALKTLKERVRLFGYMNILF